MKSVTIRNKQGEILVKVIHRKSGGYDLISTPEIARDCEIEVRADDGSKVIFGGSSFPGSRRSAGKIYVPRLG